MGDIHSYGILLVEMFTGKRPTDDMFKDGLSMHQFTAMALPDHVMDVVEPHCFFKQTKTRMMNTMTNMKLTRKKDP